MVFESRNPDVERDLLEQACRGRVDPGPILEAMQRRASKSEHGGDRLRVGIDWFREAAMEPPDSCNYIVWGWLANLDRLDTDSQANLMLALMELASAFNRVELVRARLDGYEDA
jgi:hypothetical protein